MILKLFFFVLAVNLPAFKAQEEAPCEVDNVPCMRDYFASNSNCDPKIFRKMPNTLTYHDKRFDAPYFNMSHIDQTLIIRNMDRCKVRIIYRNDTSRITGFGIDCPNLHVEAERVFDLRTLGRPVLRRLIRVVADYDYVRLAVNFHGNSLNLCHETAYAWTSLPTLFLQGRDTGSVDFVRRDPRGAFGDHLDVWIREIWAARATPLLEAWIRNMMCDFKCSYKRFQ